MSEKEKRIVEKLKDAIPQMSDFDKGYILGKVEKFSEFSQTSEDSGKKKKIRERETDESILCAREE